ncbi:hypothetical protein CMI42_01430 [Candidatus Pacearchaeota archaeon]|nr:hypothetical protein [Candidatus Pacearchaeota archaeon]|tara:strand:+ start:55 stop:642 length:588 start_codon:yes stop_codon:yes gene_type:complete
MDPLEFLDRKMNEDVRYSLVLPLSLNLHRFVRDHQDYTKPRLLIRSLDEVGFTTGVRLNDNYDPALIDKYDQLMREINDKPCEKVSSELELLDRLDNYSKFEVMLLADRAEEGLYKAIASVHPDKEQVDKLPPFIKKEYDENGFAVTYAINEKALNCSMSGEGINMEVVGLPITDSELQGIDIQNLMNKLFGITE